MTTRATFTRMEESTHEDWAIILLEAMAMAKSLSHFEPMLRRLMAVPKSSVYTAALPGGTAA